MQVHTVREALGRVRLALSDLQAAQTKLVSWLSTQPVEGWIAGNTSGARFSKAPDPLLRVVDSLEYEGQTPLRVPGLIRIHPDGAAYVIEVNRARLQFDQASLPFRMTRRNELEQLPEATDLGGGKLQHWQSLSPNASLWKAVAATLGCQRLSILQVTRQFLTDGLDPENLPIRVGFCWTFQPKISLRSFDLVETELRDLLERRPEVEHLVREDLIRLAAFHGRYPEEPLAFIGQSSAKPSVNLAWPGQRKPVRKVAVMPLFWTGKSLPEAYPLPATPPEVSTRMPRRDRKYSEEAFLRTLNYFIPRHLTIE